MNLKVSNKLGRRERRYMFNNRVNKMIYRELAKNIQIEIDNQIVSMLKDIAANEQVNK
jgi:hypothetical protein